MSEKSVSFLMNSDVLDEEIDRIQALEVGEVDYLTQLFQYADIIAIVSAHIKLSCLHRQLKEHLQELTSEIVAKEKAQADLALVVKTISHDLTNPLVSMKYILSSLVNKASSQEVSELVVDTQVLSTLLGGCDRALGLIELMVKSQKIKTDMKSPLMQEVSLMELVKEIYFAWTIVYNQQNASLSIEIPSQMPVIQADRSSLLRVFDNLLSNALKHNPTGVDVIISVQVQDEKCLRVTVADNGVGIEEPEKVFTSFQRDRLRERAEKPISENGQELGFNLGLGLYICQQIISDHGGNLGVESLQQQGSTFWFTLPIK